MELVIPEVEGVPEMQSCPLYVGVVLLVCGSERHEKKVGTRVRNSGTRDKSQGDMARGRRPWGDGRIARNHGSPTWGLDNMTLVRCPQHRVALDDLEKEFLQTLAD
jgi:hypothetical protein